MQAYAKESNKDAVLHRAQALWKRLRYWTMKDIRKLNLKNDIKRDVIVFIVVLPVRQQIHKNKKVPQAK